MPVTKLAHYSVRTTDLEGSCRFYTRVLGFRQGHRPPFAFPGAWLYQDTNEADLGVVHIIGIDTDSPAGLVGYLGDKAADQLKGSGAVDHLAFLATGLAEMRETLRREQLEFRERTVPDLHLHQVFLEDPSGVTIELNYPAHEVSPPPTPIGS